MYAHLNEDWENNGTKVFLNSNSAIVMQKTLFKLLGNYKVPLYRSSRHLEFAFLGETNILSHLSERYFRIETVICGASNH